MNVCNLFLLVSYNVFIIFTFRDSASYDRYEKLIYAVSIPLLCYLVNAIHSDTRKSYVCYTENDKRKPKKYENLEEEIWTF
jgi:hypothetical protein